MDAEDCEPFTDVYWMKFRLLSNARFAKRKLDDFVFLGNRLHVLYASHFESLLDTKDKLEGRRREVLARLNPRRSNETTALSTRPLMKSEAVTISSQTSCLQQRLDYNKRDSTELEERRQSSNPPLKMVSSNEDYFASHSMNQTVSLVREKLNKIQSSSEHMQAEPSKKTRVDNRRRI